MEIKLGDITKIESDAIVNAANTRLEHGGGVAAAILRSGGKTIQKESMEIGFCDIGKVAVTSAGDLPAKSVLHIPTIDYDSGRKATLDDIKLGVRSALEIATNSGFKKVTFPLLGSGVVGLPPAVVARNIKEAAEPFPEIKVVLVIKSKKTYSEIKDSFGLQRENN